MRILYNEEKTSFEQCIFLLVIKRIPSLKSELLMVHDLLGASDEEDTAVKKALSVLHKDLILCLFGKIDEHITADDKVITLRIRILEQVMLW